MSEQQSGDVEVKGWPGDTWRELLDAVGGQAHSALVAMAAFRGLPRYHDHPDREQCNGPSCKWYRDGISALESELETLRRERDDLVRWRHGLTKRFNNDLAIAGRSMWHTSRPERTGDLVHAFRDDCTECAWLAAHPLTPEPDQVQG